MIRAANSLTPKDRARSVGGGASIEAPGFDSPDVLGA